MKNSLISFLFTSIISLITAEATYSVYGISVNWCEYGFGKVKLNVEKKGESSTDISFNITLYDTHKNYYIIRCKIVERDEDQPEKYEEKENEYEYEYEKEDFSDEDEDKNKGGQIIDIDIDFTPEKENHKENENDGDESHSETQEKDEDIDDFNVDIKDPQPADLVFNDRKLEEVVNTYVICYFDKPKEDTDLHYLENSLIVPKNYKDNIKILESTLIVHGQKCLSNEILDKKISFRQLSHFEQVGKTINFWFYTISRGFFEKGYTIEIYIYLKLLNGKKEEKERKVICKLQEEVDPEDIIGQSDYKCSIEGLTKQYSLLIFSKSTYISDIPDNETLLDPLLTDNAIKEGKLIDYSLPENKEKIPTFFSTFSLSSSNCANEGKIIIGGISYGKPITKTVKVEIPLSHPRGVKASCLIEKAENLKEFECELLDEITDELLIIEQRTIKVNGEDFLLIGGVMSDLMTCINSKKYKLENNLNKSFFFRQLSKFKQLDSIITFKFYTLTYKERSEGYNIYMWVNLILPDGTKDIEERKANCTLISDINLDKLNVIQADFDCKIEDVDPSISYKSFELSSSNDFVGIPEDKSLLDPVKTEEEIALGNMIDFSKQKNKIVVPVKIDRISINDTSCSYDGTFKLDGLYLDNFEFDKEFILKDSFPEDCKSKCVLN